MKDIYADKTRDMVQYGSGDALVQFGWAQGNLMAIFSLLREFPTKKRKDLSGISPLNF